MTESKIPKYLIDQIDCDDSDFFLTDEVTKVDLEIYNNCVYIGLTSEERQNISAMDLEKFIAKVKIDRKKRLINSNIGADLIYYMWSDEQAGQLRFNFINSNHKRLPFATKLSIVDTEKEIIESYLKLDIADSTQFDGISKIIDDNEQNNDQFILKVFFEIIDRN